ncbi:uracil-DNA glycosylase [Thermoproteota archaeon]
MDFNASTLFDDMNFQQLSDTCMTCTRCKLHQTRTNVVFGRGLVPCTVMVIGEGPGRDEDSQGIPFVGRAGQLLTDIFKSVGIDREADIYITNIVKCRPPNNRNPEEDEIKACQPYLIRQIHLIQPKIILLLGAQALKAVLDEKTGITKVRGRWYKLHVDYMDEKLSVMPMFHPSYLLRNESKAKGSPKWLTWQDIKEVKSALDFYRH